MGLAPSLDDTINVFQAHTKYDVTQRSVQYENLFSNAKKYEQNNVMKRRLKIVKPFPYFF